MAVSVIFQKNTKFHLKRKICNKKITTSWKSLEQMTRKTPLTFSEIHKINKLIPNIIGLFDKLDNTSQALIWKKIIQLPFDSNR